VLWWNPAPYAGWYNLYVSNLPDFSDLACMGGAIPVTTAGDGEIPPAGAVRFYLIGAANCTAASGLGFDWLGNSRPAPPACQ
jgi:hypothetical protein